MVAIFGFSRERVLAAVQEMYTAVANSPRTPFHFPVGRAACLAVGYSEALLEGIPDAALESFAGVGCPFRADVIRPGDTVIDIGSGSGTDALIAAQLTGPTGRVIALDLTPAMVRKLKTLAAQLQLTNLQVIEASAESIPLADASVDVVTSNGMLNLVPDKRRALAEIFRMLKPGGRVQIADIVIRRPVTLDCKADPKLWAECVVGATVDEDYAALFRDAGFDDVAVLHEADYFALSRSEETRAVARRFGAYAVELSMRRAAVPLPRLQLWARRSDPRRAWRALERRGWADIAALAGAMLACYGTVAATALLSAAGVALALNDGAVSAVILAFAVLAVAAVGAGLRKHRRHAPFAVALAGGATLLYAHLVDFSYAVELLGFVVIGIAIALDLRARSARLRPRRRDG